MYVASNNIRMPTQHQLVIMKHIKSPCESCKKEFEKPIVVTNFSFTPKKESYYACPYCLTKIGTITNECDCTQVNIEETGCTENWKQEEKRIQSKYSTIPRRVVDRSNVLESVTMEKLESLEKQRSDLLAELDQLRNGAMQKICNLTEEVSALRKEAESLKKLTNR